MVFISFDADLKVAFFIYIHKMCRPTTTNFIFVLYYFITLVILKSLLYLLPLSVPRKNSYVICCKLSFLHDRVFLSGILIV